MSHQKYAPPTGPPPAYPQQPPAAAHSGGANQDYYGAPQANPYQPNQAWGSAIPQQHGPPAPGPYGPPYQQQPMYYGQQPAGYYYDDRRSRGGGAGTGICAGLFAALGICCCIDLCIF